jgi:three-Cys-motif partner protein
MAKFNPIKSVQEDGLFIPDIGNWGEKKYNLVGHYCNLFTSAMRYKWNLVYIDLFAGAGYAKIKETKTIVKTSSLIAMNIPYPFDYYILCEYDEERFNALKARAEKEKKERNLEVEYVLGDSNTNIDKIIAKIPKFNNGKGVLTFCFVDPFSLNLHFDTIVKLGQNKVDLLILMALEMDARRNLVYYFKEENDKIEKFLADKKWREKLTGESNLNTFIKFLSDQYDMKMLEIGYQKPPDKERIKMDNGTGLYYLAFYSKHPLGNDFFEKIRKGTNDQYSLF